MTIILKILILTKQSYNESVAIGKSKKNKGVHIRHDISSFSKVPSKCLINHCCL